MDQLLISEKTRRELREKGYTPEQIEAAAARANVLLEEPRRSLTAPAHQHIVSRTLKGLAAIPAGMAGAATRMLDYMDPNRMPSPEEVNQAHGIVKAIKEKTAERANLSLGEATQRNLSDFTTGATQAFSEQFLANRPDLGTVISQAYGTGQGAPMAIGAQLAETMQHPKTYPIDFAMNALPVLGSARSGLAAGSAALAKKPGMLGTLGKVGGAVARGTDVAQGVTTLLDKAGVVPGSEKLFARMRKFADEGIISEEAAKAAQDSLSPLRRAAAYHNVNIPQVPKGLVPAANIAKGAALGGLLGGGEGALVGAGLAGGVEGLAALKPGLTAATRRMFVDPYAAKTPEETARTASIIDPMYQQESAMRDVAAEAGQEYGAGKVDWHPDLSSPEAEVQEAAKAPVPAGIRERLRVSESGPLEPLPEALDKRAEIANKALEMEHEAAVYRKIAKDVADIADVEDPRWQMLQYTVDGLQQKYSWLSYNLPEVSRAAFNAKMKSVMQSMYDALAARDKYTVANGLREYADAADAFVDSVKRGAPHEPNADVAKALEASQVQAGLGVKQAERMQDVAQSDLQAARRKEAYERGIAREQERQAALKQRLNEARAEEKELAIASNKKTAAAIQSGNAEHLKSIADLHLEASTRLKREIASIEKQLSGVHSRGDFVPTGSVAESEAARLRGKLLAPSVRKLNRQTEALQKQLNELPEGKARTANSLRRKIGELQDKRFAVEQRSDIGKFKLGERLANEAEQAGIKTADKVEALKQSRVLSIENIGEAIDKAAIGKLGSADASVARKLDRLDAQNARLAESAEQIRAGGAALAQEREALRQRSGLDATRKNLASPIAELDEAVAATREAKAAEYAAKHVPDEAIPKGHPAATDFGRGLDIASGVRKPISPFRVPAKTSNPRVEAAIDRLHEIGNASLDKADQIPRHFYARAMTDALRKTGMSLLQDPQTRGYVTEKLIRELEIPKSAQKAFRQDLQKRINEYESNYFGPVEKGDKSLVLQMPDGTEKDLTHILAEALPEDKRAMAQQNAVERVGMQLGQQAAQKHLIAEVKRELNSYHVPLDESGKLPRSASIEDYAANVAKSVAEGGHIPLMTPYKPGEIADVLNNMASKASVTDAKRLRDIGARLKEQTPATGEFQKLLADNGIHNVHVSPAFAETVEAKLYAQKMMGQVTDLSDALTSWTKAGQYLGKRGKVGQTVLSAKNAIHNWASNAIETSLFSGKDPMTTALQASTDALERAKFMKTGQGPDAKMWRGISRGGLSGLANVDSELGTLAGQRRGAFRADVGVGEAAVGTLRAAENLARTVHSQTGDMMWKTSAAKQAYKGFAGDLAKLKDGEYLGIPLPHDEMAVLTKTPNGYAGLGKTFAPDSQELADLLGTAAVNSAQKLFFHGERQPLLLQKLKHAPWISPASPFVNWAYNAVELPFKPGILSRVLSNGLNIAVTNSPAIHAANAAKFAALALRRMALTSAMRQYVDPALDPVRRIASYKPSNPAMGILPGAGADEVNVVSGQSMDPLAPTELMLAGGLKLFQAVGGKVPTIEELKSADPQTRARIDFWTRMQSGVDFSADDARELGMISGGPLFHAMMDDSRPASQKAAWLTASLLGGTLTDVARYAMEPSPLAPSQQEPHRIDPLENFLKMVFDYGTRPVLMTGDKGRIQRNVESIAKGLHESLDKQAKLDFGNAVLAQRADSASEALKHSAEARAAQAKIYQAKILIDEMKKRTLQKANAALQGKLHKTAAEMPADPDDVGLPEEEKEPQQEPESTKENGND